MRYAALLACAAALSFAACGQTNEPVPNESGATAEGEAGYQPDSVYNEPGVDPGASPGYASGRSSAATGASEQGLGDLPAGDAQDSEQQP